MEATKKMIKRLVHHGYRGVDAVYVVWGRKYVYVLCEEAIFVRIDMTQFSKYKDILITIAKEVCNKDRVRYGDMR